MSSLWTSPPDPRYEGPLSSLEDLEEALRELGPIELSEEELARIDAVWKVPVTARVLATLLD